MQYYAAIVITHLPFPFIIVSFGFRGTLFFVFAFILHSLADAQSMKCVCIMRSNFVLKANVTLSSKSISICDFIFRAFYGLDMDCNAHREKNVSMQSRAICSWYNKCSCHVLLILARTFINVNHFIVIIVIKIFWTSGGFVSRFWIAILGHHTFVLRSSILEPNFDLWIGNIYYLISRKSLRLFLNCANVWLANKFHINFEIIQQISWKSFKIQFRAWIFLYISNGITHKLLLRFL